MWHFLKIFALFTLLGSFWNLLLLLGTGQHFLAIFGVFCIFKGFVAFWGLLANFWQILVAFDAFWLLFTYLGKMQGIGTTGIKIDKTETMPAVG